MSTARVFPQPSRRWPWAVMLCGLLLVLLTTALGRVVGAIRGAVYLASCHGSLNGLSLAVSQYAQDYDEVLPPAWSGPQGNHRRGGWMAYRAWPNRLPGDFDPSAGVLWPYLKNELCFVCPTDTSGRGCSYSLSAALTQDGAAHGGLHHGRSRSGIASPATTPMMVEELHALVPGPADGCAPPGCRLAWERHRMAMWPSAVWATNIMFADGHVKAYEVEASQKGNAVPNWQRQSGGPKRGAGKEAP